MASKINADEFVDREGEGKPTLPKGVVLSGVTTITTATVADNEIANSTGINAGIITSTHFKGNLTGDVNAGIVTVTSQSVIGSGITISASGIHARHNPHYIRTVRGDKKDPLTKMMVDMGFPAEDDVMKPHDTTVFSFPIKCSPDAVFRQDMTAIEQLELWKTYQVHWCEHKPSVTISVKEEEWIDVGAWVYKNFDLMSGVSFLPYSEHTYKQAPYQDCNEKEYKDLLNKMPTSVDWNKLSEYEKSDMTVGSQELACSAGSCEIQ